MIELTRTERRVLVWLEAADFDNTGCRHSQKTIAAGAQCTVRTVIRATQHLGELGLITVNKERRPGIKWLCNVYHVRDWNPRKRSGVLNVLAARREAKCHAEGTATAARAQTPAGNPSLRASKALPARSQARTRGGFEFRRTRMDQRRHLRLEVDCPECARKDQVIRQYAENHSKLVEEVSGAQEVARAVGKENATLKRRRTREAREDARAEQIMQVGEYWLETHPRAKFPEGEKRWELVRKALSSYSVAELLEALEGARLKPFVRYGTRIAKAVPGCGRKDDLADVLRDETTIEECRGICQRARMSPAERLWAAYRALSVPAEAYWRLAVDAAVEVPDESDGLVDVDGIETRVD